MHQEQSTVRGHPARATAASNLQFCFPSGPLAKRSSSLIIYARAWLALRAGTVMAPDRTPYRQHRCGVADTSAGALTERYHQS